MTSEQMDQVKAATNTLPDRYSLVQLDPNRHAALIGEHWGQTDAEHVRRIKYVFDGAGVTLYLKAAFFLCSELTA